MQKNLKENKQHADLCHNRWMEKRNRKQENQDYKDEWYSEQCGGCIYYIRLVGELSSDYGACTNPESDFDSIVRFEHDGCDKFTQADEW